MSLREVWYGGDGGTEAKQARTSEGGARLSFVTGLRGREKRGRKKKERRLSLGVCGIAPSGRWEKDHRCGRREGGRICGRLRLLTPNEIHVENSNPFTPHSWG